VITYLALLVGFIAVVYVLAGSIRRRQPASEWLSPRGETVVGAIAVMLAAVAILSWLYGS